jgi:hypothetical protein
LKLVQEDNERWKNRAQQILQKYEVSSNLHCDATIVYLLILITES